MADDLLRPSWDEYFMNMADLLAKRGSCDRAQVGAVLVKNNRIVAHGYNGGLFNGFNCSEVGHMFLNGEDHCVRTVHAEMNALIQVALTGSGSTEGCVLYVTHFPCFYCLKHLVQARVGKIIYRTVTDSSRDMFNFLVLFAEAHDVEVYEFGEDGPVLL